ncbi:hypothetical protein [Streptomyces coerulescens]|uniref:Uncharacterized protein n=1 Tax=Streptomyces coerulescens TaxID=29304 RepID=A0ABW0CNE5_STRCD
MARIRVLEAIAGADFSWAPGDVVDVSEEEAASWADGHRAALVDGEDGVPAEETATTSHLAPLVVGEDGQELEVLDATLEAAEPPADAEDGQQWVRWSVTVRLPAAAASADGDQTPADPADLENEDPEQEAEEVATPFDPREHTNKEVLAYLDTVGEQEALRVLEVEASEGENRAGIAKNREQVLEAARLRDEAEGGSQLGAEKTADYSRGGGGAETPETRSW